MTPTLIVVEATGGYERALVATLAGLPLVVVNPRLVGHRLTTGSSLRIVAVRFR
jgi:transposase